MKAAPIRISIVNYTNTLPFKWALRGSPLLSRIELQEDIPSICAQKLKYGQVDLALMPVAVLPELGEFHLVGNYCIGAEGRVDSVKLYACVPLDQVSEVMLDYQSRSSVALAKVLFRRLWKKEVKFLDSVPGFEKEISGNRAAVVIGDRTFSMNGRYACEVDLAEEWKTLTGLPFVFAAWVSTRKLPEEFVSEFDKVMAYGVSHIREAISAYPGQFQNGHREMVEDYLLNKIDYRLSEAKLKALDLFLSYLADR